jgi:ABC-type proline/glycine betaine transport system permease subunit
MCSSNARKLERQRIQNALDQKLEQFLQHAVQSENLSKTELNCLLQPIKWLLWKIWLKIFVKAILVAIVGYVCVQKIEFINCNLSAIGRLLMIQVIPYWDWSLLYNEKCLISTVPMLYGTTAPKKNENRKSFGNDCVVCENMGE